MAKTLKPLLETVFHEMSPLEKQKGVGTLSITTCEGTKCSSKSGIFYGYLGDLNVLGNKLEILNLYKPEQVVRKIMFTDQSVIIDINDGKTSPISLDKRTKVYYEPWFMDRGSYVIWIEQFKMFGKLATEGDLVRVVS
jgi:hypothetical protein